MLPRDGSFIILKTSNNWASELLLKKGCSGADVRADILCTTLYAMQIYSFFFHFLCEKCKHSVIKSEGKECNTGVAFTGMAGFFLIFHAPFIPTLNHTLIRIEWPHKAPLFPRSQVDQHLKSSIEVRDAWTCICCNSEYIVWWLFTATTLTYSIFVLAVVAAQDKNTGVVSFFQILPSVPLHINLLAPKLDI